LLLAEVIPAPSLWGDALMLAYWAMIITTVLSILDRGFAQRQS
jgi:hypothetical protein